MTEQRSEPGDDLVYHLNEHAKRWQKRLTLRRPAWLKRYVEGELSPHIRFRSLFANGMAQEYCAVFERADVGIADSELGNVFALKGVSDPNSTSSHNPDSEVEYRMFVSNIELVKDMQEVPVTAIPPLVRLNVLDGCNHAFAYRTGRVP